MFEWSKDLSVIMSDGCESSVYESTLHEVFGTIVRKYPECTAISFGSETLTYRQLDEQSNQVARVIIDLGLQAGENVPLIMGKGIDFFVAMMGVIKAGGCYVPIDPEYPQKMIGQMLKISRAKIVIAEKELCERYFVEFEESGIETALSLNGDLKCSANKIQFINASDVSIASNEHVSVAVDSISPLYMIFTSGTTGVPKGVINSHRSVLNLVAWSRRELGLTSADSLSQLPSLSFDASVYEIFSALTSGAHLCVFPSLSKTPTEEVIQLLLEKNISITIVSPSALRLFLPVFESLDIYAWTGLRVMLCGGEALPFSLVSEVYRIIGHDFSFINVYGPTETTVFCTTRKLTKAYVESCSSPNEIVPIGAPMPNVSVILLKEDNTIAEKGEEGEICVAGDGLALGYYGDEKLTAEVFLDYNYEGDEIKIYKTGDLARIDSNSELIFLGRVNEQVKIRGYRVEIQGVEKSIKDLPGVKDAVVISRKDRNESNALFAFYIPEHASVGPELVRGQLEEILPYYMIPSRFVEVGAFPMTTRGKVDKDQLQCDMNEKDSEVGVQYYELSNQERDVVESWRQVLKVSTISRNDNFYNLGGDSIAGLRVVSILAAKGYEVKPIDLINHATVSAFAGQLKQVVTHSSVKNEVCHGRVELTPIQYWFSGLKLEYPDYYHQSMEFEISETLVHAYVEKCINTLINHHDMLRASFRQSSGGSCYEQSIAESISDIAVEYYDFLEKENSADEVNEVCLRLRSSVKLDTAPLMKVALIHLANGCSRIVWIIHHIIVDSVSWNTILIDFSNLYHSLQSKGEMQLPVRTTSYQDYASFLADRYGNMNGDTVMQKMEYWEPVMKYVDGPESLPGFISESKNITENLEIQSFVLSAESTKLLLKESVNCYSMTVEEMVLAALYCSYATWAESENIVLDVEWNGRGAVPDEFDLSRTVGWFTTIFPFYLNITAADTMEKILISLKEAWRAIPAHGAEFGRIRYLNKSNEAKSCFGNYKDPSIIVNYSGRVERKYSDWKIIPISAVENHGNNRNPYCIACELFISDDKLVLELYYSKSVFKSKEISRWGELFLNKADLIISHTIVPENAKKTPSDFKLLDLELADIEKLPCDVVNVMPLSDLQKAIYVNAKKSPESSIYHVQIVYSCNLPLDLEKFNEAFIQLSARHEMLRTSFHASGFIEPIQIVHSEINIRDVIKYDNIAALSTEEQQKFWRDCMERYRSDELMILENAPLFRINLLKTGDQSFHYILNIHHLIHDGFSLALLMKEFRLVYSSLLDGRRANLPDVYGGYENFITVQKEVITDELMGSFWAELLDGARKPYLPYDYESTEDDLPVYGNDYVVLPPEKVQQIKLAVRKNGMTLNDFFLTALVILLSKLCQSNDVVLGVVTSVHNVKVKSESVFGCCLNTVPLRIKIDKNQSIMELSRQIQRTMSMVLENNAYPLSKIIEKSGVGSDSLFDVVYSFESYDHTDEQQPGLPLIVDGYETVNYPLAINVSDDSQLFVKIASDKTKIADDTLKRYSGYYSSLIDQLLKISERENAGTV